MSSRIKRMIVLLVAGLTALAIGGAPPARATGTPGGLPPLGSEIPMSMLAINVPMHVRDAHVSVDFRGGIKTRTEVNPDDPINSVRLRVVGFRMTAELPGRDGGTITIEQNDMDIDANSMLRLTQRFPPGYEQLMVLSFTMTIDQPGDGRYEPLVLTTKDPAKLIGHLTQFPPRGDLYQLQDPVDLVLPDDPDTTIATIQKFPVKLSGF